MLLLLGACLAASARQPEHPQVPRQRPGLAAAAAPAAAPALVHSIACTLAGGWCPYEAHGDWAAAGSSTSNGVTNSSSSSSSSSTAVLAGSKPEHKPLLPLSAWDVAGFLAAERGHLGSMRGRGSACTRHCLLALADCSAAAALALLQPLLARPGCLGLLLLLLLLPLLLLLSGRRCAGRAAARRGGRGPLLLLLLLLLLPLLLLLSGRRCAGRAAARRGGRGPLLLPPLPHPSLLLLPLLPYPSPAAAAAPVAVAPAAAAIPVAAPAAAAAAAAAARQPQCPRLAPWMAVETAGTKALLAAATPAPRIPRTPPVRQGGAATRPQVCLAPKKSAMPAGKSNHISSGMEGSSQYAPP